MSDELQHRMIDYAVPPPRVVWENIVSRLNDDQKYAVLSDRLKQIEIAPPAQSLDEIIRNSEAKYQVKPKLGTRLAVYRMAAAAIVAGVFIIGWMILHTGAAVTGLATKINLPLITPAPDKTNNGTERSTVNAIHAGLGTDTGFSGSASRSMKGSQSFIGAAFNENILRYALISKRQSFRPVSRIKAPPLPDKKNAPAINLAFIPNSNRYLLIKGPGGQLTRISSKFIDVIHFLSATENSSDQPEQSMIEAATWQQRFKEWRTEISESSYLPTSTNFLDILALRDLILGEK